MQLPSSRVVVLALFPMSAWAEAPGQLMVDLKPCPALGVSATPTFRWAVASCADATDSMQTAYEITVTEAPSGAVVWQSGSVASEASSAAYGGPPLNRSSAYAWSVATTGDACGTSEAASGGFVTGAAWANASFIWTATSKNAFAFFRGEVPEQEDVERATLYASGLSDDFVLCASKVWVAGTLLGCGPGRGEAPFHVDGAAATYAPAAYDTYDVTALFRKGGGPVPLAVQGVASASARPQVRGVLVQVDVVDGRGAVTSYATDETWLAYDADAYLAPDYAKSWYQGSKRVRKSQLQRLLFRSFSTRFG